MEHVSRPVLAGILTALVGFTSSFAVVLAGLRGVGASPAEAASGLLAVCATQALGVLWLVRRHRIPLTLAWSTPGAALLASTGVVHGGWPAAVGAFLVTGALLVITGLWPRLGRLIAAIPAPIAQAMLAGVVLELCLAPVRGFAAHPWLVGPILLTWAVMLRLARRWAVPAAFAATLVVIAADAARASQQGHGGPHGALVPHLAWTAPTLTWASLLGLAIPLYVVTMAGQNIPGVAVMASYGYQVPWRETMTVTGLGGHHLRGGRLRPHLLWHRRRLLGSGRRPADPRCPAWTRGRRQTGPATRSQPATRSETSRARAFEGRFPGMIVTI
jgi:benzoate membrane transport protein